MPSCLKQQSRGLTGLGERAKERRQGLGWLVFKVACRAQSPDLSPPQISSALRSSLCHAVPLSRVLSRSLSPPPLIPSSPRRPSPSESGKVLFLSLSPGRSFGRDARRPARSPASRDPRVQHRFSYKNSPRSTLSLGYYFLPGTVGVKSGAMRCRSAPGILRSVNARRRRFGHRAPYARYQREERGSARRVERAHVTLLGLLLGRVCVYARTYLRSWRRARKREEIMIECVLR